MPVATSCAKSLVRKHTGTPKATKERFGEPLRQRLLSRLRTSFAAEPRKKVRSLSRAGKTKRTGIKPVLFVLWRGREDSNFRTGNPAYILSRDASYSLLSTPTRIPLKNGRKPLFTQFALQLYTIFFCLSIVFCFYLKFW